MLVGAGTAVRAETRMGPFTFLLLVAWRGIVHTNKRVGNARLAGYLIFKPSVCKERTRLFIYLCSIYYVYCTISIALYSLQLGCDV